MPLPVNYEAMGSSLLIEALQASSQEVALLTYDDAPLEELSACQQKIDRIAQEINRRMAW